LNDNESKRKEQTDIDKGDSNLLHLEMDSSVEPVELNVPTIDLAATISDDDVVEIVSNACAEYGFFQIINHGISSDLIDCYLYECRRYFELPLEVRN
jgi:hypothetical protein